MPNRMIGQARDYLLIPLWLSAHRSIAGGKARQWRQRKTGATHAAVKWIIANAIVATIIRCSIRAGQWYSFIVGFRT